MRNPWDMLLFIAVVALATTLTRFLPFWLPARFSELRFVKVAQRSLPAVILVLLTIYSLKDATYLSAPWGFPELVSLTVVMGLHVWKKNALLSIAAGTALYMVLVNDLLRL